MNLTLLKLVLKYLVVLTIIVVPFFAGVHYQKNKDINLYNKKEVENLTQKIKDYNKQVDNLNTVNLQNFNELKKTIEKQNEYNIKIDKVNRDLTEFFKNNKQVYINCVLPKNELNKINDLIK